MPDPVSTTTVISTRRFDTSAITRLNGDNYRVWKLRMVCLFKSHKILEVVDGSTTRPSATGSDPALWDQANNEAETCMLLSMGDDQVEAVSSCKTAAEIFKKLSSIYESTSGESKQALWQKYYSVIADEKSPVKTMIEIQNIAAQLRNVKLVIDDEAEVARVVSSLMGVKYRQFREAWRSVDLGKQTSALLLSRLKTFELEDEESSQDVDAEYGKAFRAKKFTKEEIAIMKNKSHCHVCKLKGHWRNYPNCPGKKCQDEESGGAYAAGSLSNLWIADSGSSRHYCGVLQWFHQYEKYSVPKPVKLANNSRMYAEGVGQVKVHALINKHWKEIVINNVEYVPGGANLLSENVLLDKGLEVRKTGRDQIIYYRNGKRDIEAVRRDGLQILQFRPVVNTGMVCEKQAVLHEKLSKLNPYRVTEIACEIAENATKEESCISFSSLEMKCKRMVGTTKGEKRKAASLLFMNPVSDVTAHRATEIARKIAENATNEEPRIILSSPEVHLW